MPGSAAQRRDLKAQLQQRRAAPTALLRPDAPPTAPERELISRVFPVAETLIAPERTPAAVQDSAGSVNQNAAGHELLQSAPTPAEVGREVERLLSPLPKVGEPLTPLQDASLELLHALVDRGLHSHHFTADLGANVYHCVRAALTGGTE